MVRETIRRLDPFFPEEPVKGEGGIADGVAVVQGGDKLFDDHPVASTAATRGRETGVSFPAESENTPEIRPD